MFNLIDNTVKFSFKNGKIELELTNIDNNCVFTVKDEGKRNNTRIFRNIYLSLFIGKINPEIETFLVQAYVLLLLRNLQTLMGGSITYANNEPYESIFTLLIPNKKEFVGRNLWFCNFLLT